MANLVRRAMRWWWMVCLLAVGGGAAAQGDAPLISQSCIDNAVIRCFDGCNDPFNFQECIIGCATGANNNPQNCDDQCFGDPVCLGKCQQSIRDIRSCVPLPRDKVTVTAGVPVYNRGTRAWQQVVRLTNTTLAEAIGNLAVVLEGPPNGWNLANATGSTGVLGSGGPYVNLAGRLEPGASVQLVLVYGRAGTLPYGLVPRVYSSELR
jgi:hypothetical protein